MKIYSYDHTTFEFTGTELADRDPLVLGNWLIPSYATTVAPPDTKQNEVAIFKNDKWEVYPDWRGTVYWTKNGNRQVVERIGDTIPKGSLLNEPPPANEEESYKARIDLVVKRVVAMEAIMNGWDTPTSCMVRASYKGPWQQHGKKFAAWVDQCWVVAIGLQDDSTPENMALTDEEIASKLPKMEWPKK